MIEETLQELKSGDRARRTRRSSASWPRLRTGRAHPSLLDSIRVDAYGSPTPISQMATINVPEARMLTIKPWDKIADQGDREGAGAVAARAHPA